MSTKMPAFDEQNENHALDLEKVNSLLLGNSRKIQRQYFCFISKQDVEEKLGCDSTAFISALKKLKSSQKIVDFTITATGFKITISKHSEKFSDMSNIPTQPPEYDVFISHATKDKIPYVEKLYKELKKLGVKIFFDKEEISWGDNWKDIILNATQKSEFAIIVISENFFGREWTEKELLEFLNRQNELGQKIILPILYNISGKQLINHYPFLKEIQYVTNEKLTHKDIVILFAKEFIKRHRKR